jgi:hypothetical protein
MKNLRDFLRSVRRNGWPAHPSSEAPPVDDELLRRYIARELPEPEARHVALWVATSARWRKRYVDLLVDE